MSSSSDGARAWRHAERPDLRVGAWTRLGHPSVLGDDVTERALGRLAERTRSAASAQGYAVGWAEGRREALALAAESARAAEQEAAGREREREAEHHRAVSALLQAAEELRRAVSETCDQVAHQASDLAFEVTRELIGHELSVEQEPGAAVVRRVLAALPAEPAATVRLHPAAAESAAVAGLAERGVTVRADPGLGPEDAVVELDSAAIDLRVGTALDRLREALR